MQSALEPPGGDAPAIGALAAADCELGGELAPDPGDGEVGYRDNEWRYRW